MMPQYARQYTGHTDTFVRDRLPPPAAQPDFLPGRFAYPEKLNAAVELSDAMVHKGFGGHTALIGNGRRRTYKELSDWTNRLAGALTGDFDLKPGNRVLIRCANNPAMVACWLAATKAGAVVVNTMPALRAGELSKIVEKAQISHALCDKRLADELTACAKTSSTLKRVILFDGTANHDSELDRAALGKPVGFDAVQTGKDDAALLGFTSGTTGEPKATVHFHRDLLMIADGYAAEVLGVTDRDVFVGSPPLAFTFGLGGLAVFPLRFGAAAALLENASPANMMDIIQKYKATVCFTAPTAYNMMLAALDSNPGASNTGEPNTGDPNTGNGNTKGGVDLSSLRAAVSAGETLPKPIYDKWLEKTGKPMLDGIGATEMLHIFISNRFTDHKAACTGKPVSGYEARVVDENMNEVPNGQAGRLIVRGPTGCRYLDDERQSAYVKDGWNISGDRFRRDDEGYFYFVARNDDMIISSGYNIAGPEVEAALMAHEDVLECAVIGVPDADRGHIVEAHVVLKTGVKANGETCRRLQDFVKATIAPFKYPRSLVFTKALPKTNTGKIRRFKLRKAS